MSESSPSLPRWGWESLKLGVRAAPLGSAGQLGLTVIVGGLPALAAWFAKLLLDELTRGAAANDAAVMRYAIAGAAVAALAAIGGQLIAHLAKTNQLRTNAVLESQLFDRVNRLVGLRYFDDPAYHDRLTLAQNGARDAPGAVSAFAVSAVRGLVGVASYLVVVMALWPPLLALILLAAVSALAAQSWLARLHADAARRISASERRRAVFQLMLLNPRAAKEIRLYALGSFFQSRVMSALRRAMAVELTVSRRDALTQSTFALVTGVVAVAGTLIVAHRVIGGRASVGDVAFLAAAVAGLQSSLSGIIESYGQANRAARLFGHFLAIVGQPEDLAAGSLPPPALRQGIELRDVWFRYHDDGSWILRGASFTIPCGASIGLVGLNGAGKSTIVKLLCRFYDPQRGQILLDGVDLRDIDAVKLRRRIAVTYQDFMNFDLSASENIGIGDLHQVNSPERIRAAARLAEIDDTLQGLPRGYATMLSSFLSEEDNEEQGVLLSGGQWQRVALARSMMRKESDLLILDEPSSGLDAVAEHRIHTTLRDRRRGRTTLMVSHRLSALREADLIVVIEGGVAAEQGTHDQLMELGGGYATMFSLQASGYQQAAGAHP